MKTTSSSSFSREKTHVFFALFFRFQVRENLVAHPVGQVPIYIAYGLANVALVVVGLYALHGTLYAFLQPALDTQVASLSQGAARTQVQGMYATASSAGAFVGASLFTPLYLISFRLPLFAMGGVYGILLFIGWILIYLRDGQRV